MNYKIGECDGYYTTRNGTITSPFYPKNYPNKANCNYVISQPSGTVIELRFHAQLHNTQNYCHDYIEVRSGKSYNSPVLDKLCDKEIIISMQTSLNQVMMRLV